MWMAPAALFVWASCGSREDGPDARPDDSAPEPDLPIDPVWRVAEGRRFLGDEAYDATGTAVSIGDLGGDDTPEVMIGTHWYWSQTDGTWPDVPEDSCGWHNAGWVLSGAATSGVLPTVAFAGLGGDEDVETLPSGYAVTVGSDLSGDGEPDAVLSGQFAILRDGYPARASVGMFSGPFSGCVPGSDAVATISGDKVDWAGGGSALLTPGDLTSDGTDDLAMSLDPGAFGDHFGAAVFSGPLAGNLLTSDATVLFHGAVDDSQLFKLDTADLDHDGARELVVPAYNADAQGGRVYLTRTFAPGEYQLQEAADILWTGELGGGSPGLGSASGGDIDGDGGEDLFLGAPLLNGGGGRGYVILDDSGGNLADAPITFEPRYEGDWLGYGAAFGDFDGDGNDDIAVGLPRNIYAPEGLPGRVLVFRGPLARGSYSEENADAIWIGSEAPDAFGFLMKSGDLDVDGRDDLVIAAPHDSAGGYDAGMVMFLMGAGL